MLPSQTFNAYAAGSKVYNGGSNAPAIGRMGLRLGTAENNLASNTARRNAMLRRLQAGQKGKMMNPDWLRGPNA